MVSKKQRLPPLALAVKMGLQHSIKFLVRSGADVDYAEPRTGDGVLHFASLQRNPEVVS